MDQKQRGDVSRLSEIGLAGLRRESCMPQSFDPSTTLRTGPSTHTPGLARGFRSGFRPTGVVEGGTGLPVGLHLRHRAGESFRISLARFENSQNLKATLER